MSQITRSPLARIDLIEQYQWYAQQGDIELGERFLDAAELTFLDLLESPLKGAEYLSEEKQLQGIRKWQVQSPFGVILIFYRTDEKSINIIRVLNGYRDLLPLLDE
ncbi:MAG: type II toxin-antitoxin system RelE/ParE family toxin [Algisphaera sp.]